MMKIRFYTFWVVLVAIVSGCIRNEIDEILVVQKSVIFTAFTESGDSITKLTLTGGVGDDARKVFWDICDQIGVIAENGSKFSRFININTEPSSIGLFEGEIGESDYYYAFFPWSDNLDMEGSVVSFELPDTQIYKANSFGGENSPMVSRKEANDDFSFRNLCGVLALRMKGDFCVKSIVFAAKDESGNPIKVAGNASVDMGYIKIPEIVMANDAATSITVDCGEGVELNASEATTFHIVLPPGVYNTFSVTVATTNGHILIQEGTKPLTIKRSIATKSGEFIPVEVETIDLSLRGIANSYIVSESNYYSFEASVIGNGADGIIEGANFHAESPLISPVSADLLWAEKPSLISSISFDPIDKKVVFFSNGEKGNALIAVRDKERNVLWSWHIWCTDVPIEHKYVNSAGVFYVQDRNLGALRADSGVADEWHESVGLDYTWGRKDPFTKGVIDVSGSYSIEQSIQNPNVRTSYTANHKLWLSTHKTIYDPCPLGYRVSPYDIWTGFSTSNSYGNPENGRYFIYDEEGNYAWYPYRGYPKYDGISYWGDNYMISSSASSLETYGLYIARFTVEKHNIGGGPLRCMKDDGYIDVSVPTVIINKIDNIQTSSATITAEVTSSGKSEVIERGIVVGSKPDVTIENGEVYLSGGGSGIYNINVTNLNGLKFYVRAYAINEYGIAYSELSSFFTVPDDNSIDLSALGTANCYIVSNVGAYKIRTVKGNSSEHVGNISKVEVLWSTIDTTTEPLFGSLCHNDNFILFKTDDVFFEGNAVLAAKNADGSILWSWHIWFTDEPTEQIYPSAGILMDRNLGATSSTGESGDVKGLFYQWGRKDPFLEQTEKMMYSDEVGTIAYTIQNPTVFIIHLNENNFGDTRWLSTKTIYDPCPIGWRVPDIDVWSGTCYDDELLDFDGGIVRVPLLSNTFATYPIQSYINWNGELENGSGQFWDRSSYCWSVTCAMQYSSYDQNFGVRGTKGNSCGYGVRCQKIE